MNFYNLDQQDWSVLESERLQGWFEMDTGLFGMRSPGELVEVDHGESGFLPRPLPPEVVLTSEQHELIAESRELLGEIRGLTAPGLLPNPGILLRPLQRQEALRSSSLEGTYASDEELLLYELEPVAADDASKAAAQWAEVFNNDLALQMAEEMQGQGELTLWSVRRLHQILLAGVRGQEKKPGAFRVDQVYIGKDHRFIPPPGYLVGQCMEALEAYWQTADKDYPALVRAFYVHYQFEAIHPFLDGNGRIGRVLLSVMIAQWHGMDRSWVFLSEYFEKHRDEYVDGLFRVSTAGDWDGWVTFCLRAMVSQGQETIARCRAMLALRQEWREKVQEIDLKSRAFRLVDRLFSLPVIDVASAEKALGVKTYQTALADLERFESLGLIERIEGRYPLTFIAQGVRRIAHGPY